MLLDFAKRCRVVNDLALRLGYVSRLLPGGKKRGAELKAGDIHGAPGRSFSLNLLNGKWADFANPEHKGGDVVALVAAREKCEQGEALEKLEKELGVSALPPKPGKILPKVEVKGEPSRSWNYTDENGRLLYTAQRWEAEGFRKEHRLAMAEPEAERVPLYLPSVLAAIKANRLVFVVEGEPKADLLRSWGLCATSFAGGVGGYRSEAAKWFAGGRVIILNDADTPGRDFALRLAADILKVKNRGVKIIGMPGARFEGYDVIDWHKDGGDYQALGRLVAEAPFFEMPEETKRPLQASLSEGLALKDLDGGLRPYNWLLKDSLRRGQLGLICGPPGCCKGAFSIQLTVALAAGQKAFDFWQTAAPAKVLFVSAEDDEDILHNRFHLALGKLPKEIRSEAAGRICRMPVRGLVNICEVDKNRRIAATENLEDLKAWVEEFQPDLLILDTLARFFGVDENDNPTVTAACGMLEQVIADYGCNIILIHHASKAGGDLAGDEKKLQAALTQIAIRGASALSGCVRWALMLAPLSSELAQKKFGEEAKGKPEGSYIAARVGKKNAGKSESICFLEKGDYGLLSRALPEDETEKEAETLFDAHLLAAEVDRRQDLGLPALTQSRGGMEAFGWSNRRSASASRTAIEEGLLRAIKNEGRRGYFLAPPYINQMEGDNETEKE